MTSVKQINFGLNIGLHVCLLFTFLTAFFFIYGAKLTKKSVNKPLTKIVTTQTNILLDQIDSWDKKLFPDTYPNINWKDLDNTADKLIKDSEGELPKITRKNKNLFKLGIGTIIFLFLIFIFFTIYFMYYKKYDIQIKRILIENIIIFAFVGVVEFLFFTKIGLNYVPVTPDFASTTILERIKYRLNKLIK